MDILIAEDDAISRIVALYTIGMLGHHGVAVNDGKDALAALRNNMFNLVLMDIDMPRMGGLEAVRRIRESGAPWAGLPVVAVTGRTDWKTFMDAGMDGYVSKPYDMDELAKTIERFSGYPAPPHPSAPQSSSIWQSLGELLDASGPGTDHPALSGAGGA
ncbi:MAG: response regulator [Desulfovibrionaceae bacterium]